MDDKSLSCLSLKFRSILSQAIENIHQIAPKMTSDIVKEIFKQVLDLQLIPEKAAEICIRIVEVRIFSVSEFTVI